MKNFNKIKCIPKLPENIDIRIYQNEPIDYFTYSTNINLNYGSKIIINGYNENKPITNKRELAEYMEWVKRNMVKSARK